MTFRCGRALDKLSDSLPSSFGPTRRVPCISELKLLKNIQTLSFTQNSTGGKLSFKSQGRVLQHLLHHHQIEFAVLQIQHITKIPELSFPARFFYQPKASITVLALILVGKLTVWPKQKGLQLSLRTPKGDQTPEQNLLFRPCR